LPGFNLGFYTIFGAIVRKAKNFDFVYQRIFFRKYIVQSQETSRFLVGCLELSGMSILIYFMNAR
jgi:hypothetical protein